MTLRWRGNDGLICDACGVMHDAEEVVTPALAKKTEVINALNETLAQQRAQLTRARTDREDRAKAGVFTRPATEVFKYWQEVLSPKSRAFNGKRFDAVVARLKEGATVDELKRAVDGAKLKPYVTDRGRAATGSTEQRMVELELICRSEPHVQRFISYVDAVNPPNPPNLPNLPTTPNGDTGQLEADEVKQQQLESWQRALDHPDVFGRLKELRGWEPEAVRSLGLGLYENQVVFPVHDSDGRLTSFVFYKPNPAAQRKPKSKAEGPRNLFPRPEMFEGGTVWLVEGENDAVAMRSAGFPCVAVPGVSAWKAGWVHRFSHFDRVRVCFDCDKPGRGAAEARARSLRETVDKVDVIDLDPGRTDGFDVGDVLQKHGEEARWVLLDHARPKRKGGIPLAGFSSRNGHLSDAPIAAVLAALEARDLRPKGTSPQDGKPGWKAHCPAHDDRQASLFIADGGDRVLLTCFAGCHTEDVLAALQMSWTDAFANSEEST